jgi:hypothetical protein
MLDKVHCGLEPYPFFLLPAYPFRWGTDISVCFFEILTIYMLCFGAWMLMLFVLGALACAVIEELTRKWHSKPPARAREKMAEPKKRHGPAPQDTTPAVLAAAAAASSKMPQTQEEAAMDAAQIKWQAFNEGAKDRRVRQPILVRFALGDMVVVSGEINKHRGTNGTVVKLRGDGGLVTITDGHGATEWPWQELSYRFQTEAERRAWLEDTLTAFIDRARELRQRKH